MKRVISILLLLLWTVVLPAAADRSFSPFEYVDGQSGGGRYLYYDFPDIGLNLPIEWKDRVTLQTADDGVSFYQTASYERYAAEGVTGGGFLFQLSASEDERFRDLPACKYLGFSENAGLHFYLVLPSDDPAWPDEAIEAEYAGMAGQIDLIASLARIRPSLSFYTEGVESTDVGMS